MSLLIASENTPGHRVDRSFDSCMKCTACSSRCPVASVRPDFPGPKQCGPDGERLRLKSPDFLDDALKYCTGCKRCEVPVHRMLKSAILLLRRVPNMVITILNGVSSC